MDARLKVPPTKSALLTLKRQVAFLQEGHDLLERKRELLTHLVNERLAQFRALRKEAHESVETAYYWLGVAQLRMGNKRLRQLALGLEPAIDVALLPRSSLGVVYPAVTAKAHPLQPMGLLGTDGSLDEARLRFTNMAVLLARLAESETALWRLLVEQRKTRRRVNALRYNVIPKYRDTIHHIESALEEDERTTLYQIKVLAEKTA